LRVRQGIAEQQGQCCDARVRGPVRLRGELHESRKSVIVAVCDPIKSRRLQKKAHFGNCADYSDFREVLARKDVDAVHIATADHWHVPLA